MTSNKDFVLAAFDTLFNKRDYETAANLWSPSYIQHSAHIPPGRDGLFNLVRSAPPEMRSTASPRQTWLSENVSPSTSIPSQDTTSRSASSASRPG